MAIAIVVEDGTKVADANSYVSVEEARTFAANRGVVLSNDDDAVAVLIIKANDYLEAQRCRYQGERTNRDQALQWPRLGVVVNGEELAGNVIPPELKAAQNHLVIVAHTGLSLLPNVTAQDYVIEETVGPITTKYANPIQAGMTPTFSAVEALLGPLFATCGQAIRGLRTMRV